MSLGGYKFAGRYCQKGSLTDAQWALLMHKTKVAAFMAANTAANAGWQYDMTGSPDGNIHCLDSVGNNYVTCFKRVVDENTTHYFCVLTLTKYGGTSVTTTGYVATDRFGYNYANSTIGPDSASYYVRLGTVPFNYSSSATEWNVGQTLLIPVGNPGRGGSWGASYTNDGTNSLFSNSINYYGFAIKGSDIIAFAGPSTSGAAVSALSFDAFSSKFVDGNNKLIDVVFVNFQTVASGYTNCYEKYSGYTSIGKSVVMVTSPNGNEHSYDISSFVSSPVISCYSGQAPEYPFQAVTAHSYKVDSVSNTSARGVIKTELIAINYPPSGSTVSKFSVWANGNLLALYTYTKSSANVQEFGQTSAAENQQVLTYTAYVGWDPSNPDITQASAWTEYTDT